MRLKITFAEARPGDVFYRFNTRWEVTEVGDPLPGLTNVPITVARVSDGEEKTWNLRGNSEVWVTR